ncbi:hypothetical protein ACIGXF_21010 [Streptomyces sp. NPDC053086]|uniref:hypothetical protein n=1 Tax=unclassified Streptomyces TaxID=2593676 RepID=UPI0037CF3908
MRHGSWRLQKDPDYQHRGDLVQKQEQIRLGIKQTDACICNRNSPPPSSGILVRRDLAAPE